MRKRWKGFVAAVLGVAVLALAGGGAAPVRAAESSQGEVQQATNLRWTANGQGIFTNPNSCTVLPIAHVTAPDGTIRQYYDRTYSEAGDVTMDLYHLIDQSGTYTFTVDICQLNADGTIGSVAGGNTVSADFVYTRPGVQLPKPEVSVSAGGVVSASLPKDSQDTYTLGTDYGFNYELIIKKDGVPYIVGQQGIDSTVLNFGSRMKSDQTYYVSVRTLSRDITKYVDSDWTDLIQVPTAENQSWHPTTPDEIKRYSLSVSGAVEYTADPGNAYDIIVENSVQGEKCFDSFEAVLGDHMIGRTYNIYPSVGRIYSMDSKARITLTVPGELQADNREFKMICVTENGLPVVLEDLDTEPNTVTFETDTYYAFALIYKDAVTK